MKYTVDFKTYFTRLTADEKRSLSEKTNKSINYLSQIAHKRRRCSAALAVEIEKHTQVVTCEHLTPDVDWSYIRGSCQIVDNNLRDKIGGITPIKKQCM